MIVLFRYNFRRLSNRFPIIFWSFIFHIFLPRLGYFSYKKGNQKFSDSKIRRREESEKFSLSYLKIFREKNNWSELSLSENTVDSLKSIFNIFRRTLSLGNPDTNPFILNVTQHVQCRWPYFKRDWVTCSISRFFIAGLIKKKIKKKKTKQVAWQDSS